MIQALQGGTYLTRDQLRAVFEQGGLATAGELRMSYLLMRAELDATICSGPRHGKQFTYCLLDERVPQAKRVERDLAVVALAQRYFASRGPASVQDFANWSGLTIADAKAGLEGVKTQLHHEVVDGQSYWLSATTPATADQAPTAYLLSIYDEYMSGYKDRSALVHPSHAARLSALGNNLTAIVVLNSQIVGTWKRTRKKGAVVIELDIFTALTEYERAALATAAQHYGTFLGVAVVL